MADTTTCPRCGTANDGAFRFCVACGSQLQGGYTGPGVEAAGAVIDGVWERGDDELIRRVNPEDARRYLGTRTVRVPAGTAGVVLVNGVVDRVLPPGERTTIGLFERVASFFLRRERTAFYLVDQRPFPVPFVVRSRPSSTGRTVQTQVMVTFWLPKGDKQALAVFIANVLGDRPAVTGSDLYNLLRPEVVRVTEDVLERATAAGDVNYADAEAAIRRALAERLAPRYGLTVDATLAPLTAIASLDFHLGTGPAPAVRPCPGCRRELPASMKFCDACGARQPALVSSEAPVGAASPLFTADGQQVELDLVVRVQGQNDDFGPQAITPALAGAAAARLREMPFGALSQPGGLAALEAAMSAAVVAALQSYGLALVALSVLDARSKTGQWLLKARADLDRAKEETKTGRAWLEQRDSELDLEELTLQRVIREKRLQLDEALERDMVTLADREQRDTLAHRQAALDAAAAQRAAGTQTIVDELARERARLAQTHDLRLKKDRTAAELDELRARKDAAFEDEQRREAAQLQKLRAMAELDREGVAQEQAHELEKRRMLKGLTPEEMIALQAAELAKSEGGGAAWAAALAAKAGAEAERRHAEETRALYQGAMATMSEVARSRAEAAPVVAGGAPVVAVAGGGGEAAATRSCKACGAGMKPEARFCGACGATQT